MLAGVGVIVSLLAGHTLYSYALLSVSIKLFHLNNKFHYFLILDIDQILINKVST
jgi:hypothetical protein